MFSVPLSLVAFEVDCLLFTNFLLNGLARFKSQISLKMLIKMLFSQKKKKKLFQVRLLGQTAELNSAELKKTCNTSLFADTYVNMINFFYAFSRLL